MRPAAEIQFGANLMLTLRSCGEFSQFPTGLGLLFQRITTSSVKANQVNHTITWSWWPWTKWVCACAPFVVGTTLIWSHNVPHSHRGELLPRVSVGFLWDFSAVISISPDAKETTASRATWNHALAWSAQPRSWCKNQGGNSRTELARRARDLEGLSSVHLRWVQMR